MKNRYDNVLKTPTKFEHIVTKLLILLGVISSLNFLYWFFQPQFFGNVYLYTLLSLTLSYNILRNLLVWYNYYNISIPEAKQLKSTYRPTADILTTYYPGEPKEMTVKTLLAAKKVTYPHTTYLCDEANDPFFIDFCLKHNIVHVTRTNRINAKAGNINNALKTKASGEITLILDPDHIPQEDILDKIVPYFEDKEIGFVQIVQSYYNIGESLVALGAAEQTYQFYGPMMMTQNSYGSVNAIGANCCFRRTALDSIGGHAPGLCEDMHTAMLLYAEGWKAKYLPLVLAEGLSPSNLTAYFKQQIKWSRGTFDLFLNVYPKIFNKINFRQKIHFAIIPFHYLSGLVNFINFLLPILALCLSDLPWKGDLLFFALIYLPVIVSAILIRIFIQKWVIKKKERGFHLTGAILEINTWWIQIVGLFYTIINKKVPYIPTPKGNEDQTNFRIMIPNLAVILISITAIYYGLDRDFTPFSIAMAVFATVNICFMLSGMYLSIEATNNHSIIRKNINARLICYGKIANAKLITVGNIAFEGSRKVALPLIMLLFILSQFASIRYKESWQNFNQQYYSKTTPRYLGIFHPDLEKGVPEMLEIKNIESGIKDRFDIVSFYTHWGAETSLVSKTLDSISSHQSIPMITWEPWSSTFKSDHIDTQNNKRIFKHILAGNYDSYIKDFANSLKGRKPVFLRFAQEFDNPQYPWSSSGENSSSDFVRGWRHIHQIFEDEDVHNVVWIWNPWKAENVEKYYPGNSYVDWIGLSALNYGKLNKNGISTSFKNLYKPFAYKLKYLDQKPVIITEFGSLGKTEEKKEWLEKAITDINTEFAEIRALILFDSNLKQHKNEQPAIEDKYLLDWSISSFSIVHENFVSDAEYNFDYTTSLKKKALSSGKYGDFKFPYKTGVRFKKGQNWKDNHYVLNRKTLENDFALMKEAGIDLIYYQNQNVYNKNVINISEEYDLDLIFGFWNNFDVDYIGEKSEAIGERQEIITQINAYKKRNNIYAWNLDGNVLNNLSLLYNQPLLTFQKESYVNWLNITIDEIKKIDATRPVLVNLKFNSQIISNIEALTTQNINFDAIGLSVDPNITKKQWLNFLPLLKSIEVPYVFTSVPSKFYFEDNFNRNEFSILQNWQDQWESEKISFDGLISREGNRKFHYEKLKSKQVHKTDTIQELAIDILKPYHVSAKVYKHYKAYLSIKDQKWQELDQNNLRYEATWYLLRKNSNEEIIGFQKIGHQAQIDLKIPDDFGNYELFLNVFDHETGISYEKSSGLFNQNI